MEPRDRLLPPAEGATYPLSLPQQMVWLDQQWHPGSPLYNIGVAIRIRGALDSDQLERAVRQVAQANEALRLVLVPAADSGTGARQRLLPGPPEGFTFVDLSSFGDAAQRAEARMRAAFERPFDLGSDIPWEMQLLRISDDEHLWFHKYHHVVMDGWGINLVVNEVAGAYNRMFAGDRAPPQVGESYLREVGADLEYLQSPRFERDRTYWTGRFASLPPALFAQRAAPMPGGRSGQQAFSIPRALHRRLQALATGHRLGMMHIVLGALAVCLARSRNVAELAIGIPVHNRATPAAKRTMGMFSSLIPLRLEVSRRASFLALMEAVAAELRASYRHQRFPLSELNRELKLAGTGRRQLFDVTLSLEAYDGVFRLGDAEVTKLNTDNGHEQWPLAIHIADWHPERDVMVEFNHHLDSLGRDDAAALAGRFLNVLEAVAADPHRPVGAFPMMDEQERARILTGWNATAVPLDAADIAQRFEAQARRTPYAVAAVGDDGRFTYAELDARANALAHCLCEAGVGPEVVVGVCLPRGLDLLAALLAVLKTGGAYLPLDPGFPPDRLALMVEDARPVVLLTRDGLLQADAVVIDLATWPQARDDAPPARPCADNLAYVLYTSGSTGRPKGVQVTRRGLVNFLGAMQRELAFGPSVRLLGVTTLSFDIAVLELFLPLLHGGRTVIASRETAADPGLLVQALRRHRTNVMQATPSTWRMLVDHGWTPPAEFLVLCGGEALPSDLGGRLLEHLPSLVNLYGPTETTVWSTMSRIRRQGTQGIEIDIGRPIGNTQVYVLDTDGEPVPVGVQGELFIAGDGLARGYFGRPDLTAERFVPNPHAGGGARMYCTGDVARWTPSGALQYLGRADRQVKVRGFRIELEEVEVALRRLSAVRDVVVQVRDEPVGGPRLVAHLVAAEPGRHVDVGALRGELVHSLPEYMLPAQAVWLDRLPLTPNGKLDHKALQAPDAPAGDAGFIEPATDIERRLAALWSELLAVQRVGLDDNFFVLGGHSLVAARLISRIRAELRVELPLRAVLDAPTLGGLAQRVAEAPPIGCDVAVARADRGAPLPLSFAQQRLLFLHQLEPQATHYHMAGAVQLQGALDRARLQRAVDGLAARHEALRTTFAGGVQRISAPGPVLLRTTDLRGAPERDADLEQILQEDAHEPFDLDRGPLWRVRLIRLDENLHVLSLCVHHIVCDGWSIEVMEHDIGALYSGRELPELPAHYADYAAWQRAWLDGERLQEELGYWRRQLSDAPTLLELPTDRQRPAVQRHRGALVRFRVPATQLARLRGLAHEGQATLFMAVAAVVQLLLSRHARQDDICIGTPIASRARPEFERVVGFFANMLVLRTRIDPKASFQDLLQRVKATTLEAYAHQDLPFEQLVEALKPQRHLSHSPLFQFALALNNPRTEGFQAAELQAQRLPAAAGSAKFDMTLHLDEVEDGFDATLEYDADLFDAGTIERMTGHLLRLVDAVGRSPAAPLGRLDMLTPAEREALVAACRVQTVSIPAGCTLHSLFEQQAAARPDAVALSFEGRHLTYGALNVRANRVAHRLRALGIGPDALVGLCARRSPELIVGMLGILKAGGAYVPLDPAYPRERLQYMLADARPAAVVAEQAAADMLPALSLPVVTLADAAVDGVDAVTDSNPEPLAGADHLAYVIYTSGSTGLPKGTLLPHSNVLRLFEVTRPLFGFGPNDVWTLFHSYAFDFSVWEIWGALLYGARLVIVPHGVSRDPSAFHALLEHERVTVLNQTPSAFYQLSAADEERARPLDLRTVIFGGEALSRSRLAPWFERHDHAAPHLVNMYGITETTVHVTYAPLDGKSSDGGSIGRVIADLAGIVLDTEGGLLPVGVPGELFVSGAGLARGYLGRPDLTAQRFVPNPFGEPGSRLYATGDLVRWLADGTLEYLGRLDHQVKIRGFRIELAEIEALLSAQPGVTESVVLAREDVPGERRLVAYVAGSPRPDLEALRTQLASRLPEYMVPSAFLSLDALPLTSNGKLDRSALPAVQSTAGNAAAYEAPQGDCERAIAAIWMELLRVEAVGRRDDFFHLGGHSLLAVQVVSRVRSQLGVEPALVDLFAHPTLASYAARVAVAAASRVPPVVPAGRDQPLPLSFAQQRLWFLARLDPAASTAYHLSGGLRLRGRLDRAALRRALDRIVERHEVLRTRLVEVGGAPVQVIDRDVGFPLREETLGERTLEQAMANEAVLHFDLGHGPLIRGCLLQAAPDEAVLLLTMHHAVSDGWSVALLIDEVRALYGAFARGDEDPLPPLAIQYGDYAVWQRRRLGEGGLLHRQLQFWKERLQGAPALLELPTDRPRPPVQEYAGAVSTLELGGALTQSLKALAARHGATLFMTLLAGWAGLMSRLSGQQDVVIGTPVANRSVGELEPLIGFFVNTLPMRVDLSGRPGTAELIARVKATVLASQVNQEVPFEQIVEAVQPARSTAYSPLFQVMFSWLNTPTGKAELPGLMLERLDAPAVAIKSDLEITLQETGTGEGAGIRGTLTWSTVLFSAATAERLIAQWKRLLSAMVADDAKPFVQLPLLGAVERGCILRGWNDNAVARDPSLTVQALFEAQVRRSPHAPALVSNGHALTYEELNARANRLAHRLIAGGIGPDRLVGVCMRRSAELVVALLAILKAGGAYVPLEPDQPDQRLLEMIDDCQPAALLADAEWLGRLPAGALVPASLQDTGPDGNPDVAVRPDNLAYCIYTSGSTGRPKGALNSQRAVVNRLLWMHQTYGLGAGDAVLQKTPFAFDVSVWELFWPLLAGARLVVAGPEGHRDPHYLARTVVASGVTTLHFVPSMLQAFLDIVSSIEGHRLRQVFCSGEALPPHTVRRFFAAFPGVKLHNLYGPTEAAVDVTAWECRNDGASHSVPLGQAIANLQVHVLDEEFEPMPTGVTGEIVIAGVGLARGYLRRAGLTAERFVPNPHGAPGDRMYLTGDLGRRDANGNIEYLGRNDHQVKIRGMRVELGEVEAALRTVPGVGEAVVVARGDTSGRQQLAAYYTSLAGSDLPQEEQLRARAQRSLPEHMRPSSFTRLESIPLSSNGKLDRKALPTPKMARTEGRVLPRDETEARVAAIWQDVLAGDPVSIHDNFFDVGGTSLLVLRVHAGLVAEYGDRITVVDLFQHTSVAQQAALLLAGSGDALTAAPQGERSVTTEAAQRGERRRRRMASATNPVPRSGFDSH